MGAEVGPWSPDPVLDDFDVLTLPLADDGDHPVATLVRRRPTGDPAPRRALLHVHGFSDYFFQVHLAEAAAAWGFDVFALDLRRHGRSLRPGQLPFQCRSLDDHFEELTAALDVIATCCPGPVVLEAHSTGGLLAALYAHRGARRGAIGGLVLNSPFLALNLPPLDLRLAPVAAAAGRWLPRLPVGRLPSVYARSLHRDHGGEWSFDTAWKPTSPLVVRAGWLRAVLRAQRELQAGLSVACPVLVLRSAASHRTRVLDEAAREEDIVLDVADMARFGPGIGADTTVVAIPGGVHDLLLSRPGVRAHVLDEQRRWLAAHGLV